MTHAHTPGPWRLDEEKMQIFSPDGLPIGSHRPEEEIIANARLIAAAPELLDALVIVEMWADETYPWDKMEPFASILKQARAAIEKSRQQ